MFILVPTNSESKSGPPEILKIRQENKYLSTNYPKFSVNSINLK